MTDDLLIDGELITGTRLLRRYASDTGREVAPAYDGAAHGGIVEAITEAAAHGYGALCYGGNSYVRVGRRWWRIIKPRARRTL